MTSQHLVYFIWKLEGSLLALMMVGQNEGESVRKEMIPYEVSYSSVEWVAELGINYLQLKLNIYY